ncbi:MAG: Lrp/AsnC family transcriptional regulator [Nanoarchaeota archaeon]|nr:Lrp/AsnC family transcriptional regulator [Nanoarchaeota archaeon]
MTSKKDLLLLVSLRKNSRETLTRISKATTIPVSTIYDKIRQYQGNLILKHTTLVDFSSLGYHARTNILIKAQHESREEIKEFLLKHPNVNSVFKISNGFDFMVEAVFRHVVDVEGFIASLEKRFRIERVENHYIIEDIKKEAFLSDSQLLDLV